MVDHVIKLIEALAWPLVALAALLVLRREVRSLIDSVAARATRLSAGPVSVILERAADELQNRTLREEGTEEEKSDRPTSEGVDITSTKGGELQSAYSLLPFPPFPSEKKCE